MTEEGKKANDETVRTICTTAVRPHLFGHGVPVQVALTLVHALLVQELTLVRNEQGVANKLSNCNIIVFFVFLVPAGINSNVRPSTNALRCRRGHLPKQRYGTTMCV